MARNIRKAEPPRSRNALCYAQTAQQQKRLALKLVAPDTGGELADGPSYSALLARTFFLFLFICAMIFGVNQAMSVLV